MKCKHCNGIGKVRGYFYEKTGVNKWEKVWGDSPCDECDGTGEIKVTNEEWRKTCSAEEFAEWLEEVCFWEQCNDGESMSGWYEDHDAKYWKGWLKQPHTTIKE